MYKIFLTFALFFSFTAWAGEVEKGYYHQLLESKRFDASQEIVTEETPDLPKLIVRRDHIAKVDRDVQIAKEKRNDFNFFSDLEHRNSFRFPCLDGKSGCPMNVMLGDNQWDMKDIYTLITEFSFMRFGPASKKCQNIPFTVPTSLINPNPDRCTQTIDI